MTTAEMKDILYNKLQDEGCYFTKRDLSVKWIPKDKAVWIVVKDYEHIKFKMTTEEDDYFGKIVNIVSYWQDGCELKRDETVAFIDSKHDYRYRDAMLRLGYYIGTRF